MTYVQEVELLLGRIVLETFKPEIQKFLRRLARAIAGQVRQIVPRIALCCPKQTQKQHTAALQAPANAALAAV